MRATVAARGVPLALAGAILLAGCGGKRAAGDPGTWPLPNGSLDGARSAASSITAENVGKLRVRWRFPLVGKQTVSGIFASTPVADRQTLYVQDLDSTVFALDRATGDVRWQRRFGAPNGGPNGVALDGPRLLGATDAAVFALSTVSGRLLWERHLTNRAEQLVDVAPVAWKGLVFVSTIGYQPYGRGAIYALDERTGAVRWKFVTVKDPWPRPLEAGGGGLWYPVSVDAQGRLYAGNSNPTPWGGTPKLPNGAAFPGPVLYTDSLIVLDARRGRLLWYDQVTPHDVRDQDFEATPILAAAAGRRLVVGAGKAGRVIAWDRDTRQRVWQTAVGVHRNDVGPLPQARVTVCPGLLGGVETPMAYGGGRIFVPVVDLCGFGLATGRQQVTTVDPDRGRGRLVSLDARSGRVRWQARFGSPTFGCATVSNDVVFTATYDGTVYALHTSDGRVLWRARLGAGINACPAVVGDSLFIGAGVPRGGRRATELVAFGLP